MHLCFVSRIPRFNKRRTRNETNKHNDKSPGNDDLTKEFFERYWSEVKKNYFYHVFYIPLVKRNSAPHKDKQLLN